MVIFSIDNFQLILILFKIFNRVNLVYGLQEFIDLCIVYFIKYFCNYDVKYDKMNIFNLGMSL